MSKTMKVSLKVRKRAKLSSHGSYRAKRKPNSSIVLAKAKEEAAAQFGKDPAFREEIYGIQREGA